MKHTVGFARALTLAATCLAVALPSSPPAAGASAEGAWSAEQEVPPLNEAHGLSRTGVFPDGTLVAAWEQDDVDGATSILRSTRPPGGDWTAPVSLPVDDLYSLDSIATRPDGSLQIAYSWQDGSIKHRVRSWEPDGSVGPVGLENQSDDYVLTGDVEGDVVAERLGSYSEAQGFTLDLRYHDGSSWRRLPKILGNPGDVFVPGPGDSVWMARYVEPRKVLEVRSWRPSRSAWQLEWSRAYPKGHSRKPPVYGLDLAVQGPGRVVLAFQERASGSSGSTMRVTSRRGSKGWTRPYVLQRLSADDRGTLLGPVVAAAQARAEVAWTSSAPRPGGTREVRIAQVTRGKPDVQRLAVVTHVPGFRGLYLDVDVRPGGDVLVTYVERRDGFGELVGWLGPHGALTATTLLRGTGAMLDDSAYLVPGLAGVFSYFRDGRLLSRVLED